MSDEQPIWKRKAPITILGVLLVGIICSAIYDFFIKPGINVVANTIFKMVTLGSQSIIDYSYKNAALDPTAIPALLILVFLSYGLMGFMFLKIVRLYKTKAISDDKKLNTEKNFSKLRLLIDFNVFLNVLFIFILINSINQSVLIWRIFNTNINIISPYVNEQEIKMFKSKFSSMKSESEYLSIKESIDEVAKQHNIELVKYTPW